MAEPLWFGVRLAADIILAFASGYFLMRILYTGKKQPNFAYALVVFAATAVNALTRFFELGSTTAAVDEAGFMAIIGTIIFWVAGMVVSCLLGAFISEEIIHK